MESSPGPPPPMPPPPPSSGGAGAPVLRPLSVGEVLDRSIKLVLAHWRTLVKVVLVIVVPVQALSVVITLVTVPPGTLSLEPTAPSDPDNAVYIGGQVVTTLLGGVVYLLTIPACFKAIADAYLGGEPEWRSSLSFARRRALPVLWLTILATALLIVALVALVVPAVWLSIAWAVAVPALLLEDHRGRDALRRSFRLVRGRWWPTLGCLLVAAVLVYVVIAVFGLIAGLTLAVALFSDGLGWAFIVITGVFGVVSNVLSTPLFAAVVTLIYFDLRVRKEGFDLELLAQRIGSPGSSVDAPALGRPAPTGQYDPSPPPPPPPPPPEPPNPFGR